MDLNQNFLNHFTKRVVGLTWTTIDQKDFTYNIKILERAVYIQMVNHLKDNNILYEYQSAFRTSYSTDTCLINLQDGIRMEISKVKYVGMVCHSCAIDHRKSK